MAKIWRDRGDKSYMKLDGEWMDGWWWLVFVKFKDRSEPINSYLGGEIQTHLGALDWLDVFLVFFIERYSVTVYSL